MIAITGATGTVGKALLSQLLDDRRPVRALVRDPRRLGPYRVRVQLAFSDLGDPHGLRHALRGADTVIHLAATIRDQPPRRVEEVNGLGTLRLLRAAERAGVERFVFFSALGATPFQRTRFFRSKALAERGVRESPLRTTIFAPSIVYDRDDPWVRLMRRLALLPVLPVSGSGQARYQPIWAHDVARCVIASLDGNADARYELAGPEVLSYEQIARSIAAAAGRHRPVVHVPLPLVRSGLIWLRHIFGQAMFATWEEAELMEIPMLSSRGAADAETLGVAPKAMRDVL
ncbi:MAG TPA: NAD(P)H-binding protein [Solirubrobacterales bacterium]|nr:NAD(P)H-binding protein [Solirubrobacterales bacterium]